MTGYLQRLVDSALLAAAPAALTPVVKSTSPVFEQNQLLGLSAFHAGETDAEITAPVSENPAPQDRSAPAPPVAPGEVRQLEIAPEFPPAMPPPWPDAEVDPPAAANLPPRPEAAAAAAARAQAPSVADLGPGQPDPEMFEPAMPRMTVTAPGSERAADMLETEVRSNPVAVPADAARVRPPIASEATSETDRQADPAVPAALTGETAPALEPIVLALDSAPPPAGLEPIDVASDKSPPPVVLEPRARPDFREVEPDADQPELASPQAPRITIGRVTVELVPDPAPIARSSATPRTAAAASMIGPLGNRRARRRLFALSRL